MALNELYLKNKAKLAVQQKAVGELWRRGDIVDILLKPYQLDMYKAFQNSECVMFFLLCSRRLGKSTLLLTTAVSECLKKPSCKVLYLSTTTDQVREIVGQTAEVVLETCPESLKPVFKQKENKFVFKNNSEIRVKGLDKSGGSAIRGVKADLVIFDEACFMVDLQNILDSVVMPMVIATNGRILFGSTPPDTPGHDSIGIIARCEQDGALLIKDIYCAKDVLYTDKQIKEFEKQAGGVNSSIFRREYLAQIVVEDSLAICPSFDATRDVREMVFPTSKEVAVKYFPDTYVSMDLGFRDLTVALFGYWDYPTAQLVIQDELVWKDKRANTANVAADIKAKEYDLWKREAKYRFCDNDLRFIEDIRTMHKLRFKATDKDNKEAQVNMLNILFSSEQIAVHPRCRTLITHLKYGVWKESRKEFQRTAQLYHCDAIDALVYMVRNINRHRNPMPETTFKSDKYVMHDWGKDLNEKSTTDLEGALKELFK